MVDVNREVMFCENSKINCWGVRVDVNREVKFL